MRICDFCGRVERPLKTDKGGKQIENAVVVNRIEVGAYYLHSNGTALGATRGFILVGHAPTADACHECATMMANRIHKRAAKIARLVQIRQTKKYADRRQR